jgi:hypothetical protein
VSANEDVSSGDKIMRALTQWFDPLMIQNLNSYWEMVENVDGRACLGEVGEK